MTNDAAPVAYVPGNIVMIRPAMLAKRRKPGTFTPADLCRIGWPNRFQVLAVSTAKDGAGPPLLTLDPCCRFMENPATGEHLCFAHPSEYFQPVLARPKKKGRPDRQLVVTSPMGDVFRMDYREDDKEPGLEIQVGSGAPLVLGGELSRFLGEKFKKAGFI